jgi:hypothetical protein
MPGGKTHAPYKIVKRGTKWAVVNSIGETKAVFDSEEKARAYQRALYANVPGARDKEDKRDKRDKASILDIRDRIMPPRAGRVSELGNADTTSTSVDTVSTELQATEKAFVFTNDVGRVFINGPAHTMSPRLAARWEHSAHANPNFLYIHGRYVEADTPNRNQAFWTSSDLELGQPTVANGPLNWLHNERHIVGTITDSELVVPQREAAGTVGTHIAAVSTFWKFLYPAEAQIVEKASADSTLWYSMECTSEQVVCLDTPGRPGCGETFPYADVVTRPNMVCGHLRDKSSVRRYLEPTFYGGAIIVPPVQPGWANADATVLREAAALTERNALSDVLDRGDAEAMVAMLLSYAATRT